MDLPCEEDVNREKYQTNRVRIEQTLENMERCLELSKDIEPTCVPVVQGFNLEEYKFCLEKMEKRGLIRDYLGVGSVCIRKKVEVMRKLVNGIYDLVDEMVGEPKLHFFGLFNQYVEVT